MNDFMEKDELVLKRALHDVAIPPGLEERLLATVASQEILPSVDEKAKDRFSRRNFVWATAAAVGGVAVTCGSYLWADRRLDEPELIVEIDRLLSEKIFFKTRWKKEPPSSPVRWPLGLRQPYQWQPIESGLAKDTVAYDLRMKALVFALPVEREISHFLTAMPTKPQVSRSGRDWQHLAYWQDPTGWDGSKVLFVLAFDGSLREYGDLLMPGGIA